MSHAVDEFTEIKEVLPISQLQQVISWNPVIYFYIIVYAWV